MGPPSFGLANISTGPALGAPGWQAVISLPARYRAVTRQASSRDQWARHPRHHDAKLAIEATFADLAGVLRWIDHTPIEVGSGPLPCPDPQRGSRQARHDGCAHCAHRPSGRHRTNRARRRRQSARPSPQGLATMTVRRGLRDKTIHVQVAAGTCSLRRPLVYRDTYPIPSRLEE